MQDRSRFLADADLAVRRTAVNVLTETCPDARWPALVAAFGDSDAGVRAEASDGLRELVMVLPDRLRCGHAAR